MFEFGPKDKGKDVHDFYQRYGVRVWGRVGVCMWDTCVLYFYTQKNNFLHLLENLCNTVALILLSRCSKHTY